MMVPELLCFLGISYGTLRTTSCFVSTHAVQPGGGSSAYSEVLEVPLREESPFALVFDVFSTMLRIQKVDRLTHVDYTVLGWQVDNIREAVEQL
jgi:hypothetical protein